MIHDVLLSCLNLYSKSLPLEDFLASKAVSEFLHPCEGKVLEDIIGILKSLREIAKFSKTYGSYYINVNEGNEADEVLQNGLYLKAFCNGIERVLDEYLDEIALLEAQYLQNRTHTLLHIYQKLQAFEPLAHFLLKLISGIRHQKLHGCSILSHVHKHLNHGDRRINKAMNHILASVHVVFFKHLSHWILYARIHDVHGEFFIQCVDRNNSSIGSEKGSTSGRQTLITVSEAESSAFGDIWRYEICHELLPYFLSTNWAEKVLFIGQTVLIFQTDMNKTKKSKYTWHKSDRDREVFQVEDSLWNGREHFFFEKIQSLLRNDEHILHHYDCVIDEIKQYVTTRLSEIAINQADLVQQLKTIKEYFLLGRGEIFLDFIRLTTAMEKDKDRDARLREIVKAFETSAHNIGVSEILEQIKLSIPKHHLFVSGEDSQETIDYMQKIQMDYNINWPLHLLFSPKVMERYNMIFRFLLLMKKTQYELNMVWFRQTGESKLQQHVNPKLLHLRNRLIFFVNTLQYYIQVDVLESQFSILLNTICNKADFEQIQKAHSVFQANILSLCFLLNEESQLNQTTAQSSTLNSNHPVYRIFHEIFNLCEEFYILADSNKSEEALQNDVDLLCERFSNLVHELLTMLVSLKAVPGTSSLSQLLLRLDFNRWFSLENRLPNKNYEFE